LFSSRIACHIGADLRYQFNFPYQLGPHSSTTPRADAQVIREKVVPGDIVILASDGLGDNLWDEEVLAEVERFVAPSTGEEGEKSNAGNPQVLGEALARRAKKAAEGSKDVPFGVRGRAAGIQFMGGKTDGECACDWSYEVLTVWVQTLAWSSLLCVGLLLLLRAHERFFVFFYGLLSPAASTHYRIPLPLHLFL
jgi:hypothetical protein